MLPPERPSHTRVTAPRTPQGQLSFSGCHRTPPHFLTELPVLSLLPGTGARAGARGLAQSTSCGVCTSAGVHAADQLPVGEESTCGAADGEARGGGTRRAPVPELRTGRVQGAHAFPKGLHPSGSRCRHSIPARGAGHVGRARGAGSRAAWLRPHQLWTALPPLCEADGIGREDSPEGEAK